MPEHSSRPPRCRNARLCAPAAAVGTVTRMKQTRVQERESGEVVHVSQAVDELLEDYEASGVPEGRIVLLRAAANTDNLRVSA